MMTEFPASTSTFDVQRATLFHVNAPAAKRNGSVVGYVYLSFFMALFAATGPGNNIR